ncbi:MAG: SGNH/GDSL hydrolase family protein [Candidatus Babeliaceae bacterium]|jgi:hypothetical protein
MCFIRKIRYLLSIHALLIFNLLLPAPHIYIFGDSHARWGFSDMGQLEYVFTYDDTIKIPFSINWAPSKTMQEVSNHGLHVASYGVKKNDIALFVFGEVDVRYYIGRERDTQHKELNDILDARITSYITAINSNKNHNNTLCCIIMEVMPPARHDTYYGTIEDRVAITRALNKKLRAACEKNNILFLPLHDIYANHDGSFNAALSEGTVHINMQHNFHIRRRLIELLLASKII